MNVPRSRQQRESSDRTKFISLNDTGLNMPKQRFKAKSCFNNSWVSCISRVKPMFDVRREWEEKVNGDLRASSLQQ